MKTIIIAPIHKTYFGGFGWKGLSFESIKSYLIEALPESHIEIIDFPQIIASPKLLPQDSLLFYTSSYDGDYRKYIMDCIYYLLKIRPDVKLIPSFELLLCHENKGYQELYKKELKIGNLNGMYYGDIDDIDTKNFLEFPAVVKLSQGAGSKNVSLVKDFQQLKKFIGSRTIRNIQYSMKRLVKPFILKEKKYLDNYNKFHTVRTPFVLQDFIQDLEYDYKVLVFGKNYYALKRYVRDNDFRASGSGKFKYDEPSQELLFFAKDIYEKLGCPFISLDIAEKDGIFYLIEFQATGFGSVTLTKSDGYFILNSSNQWVYINKKSILEEQYACAIVNFLNKA